MRISMALTIKPITFREANKFVNLHHRHHGATVGCKFCVAVWNDDILAGVAICGRPVSRMLDDGLTLEINRVCTLAVKNACSKLYGACIRIGKEMGYKKIITYTLQSENGASLKASNFVNCGIAGGLHWTGARNTGIKRPQEFKTRWEYIF